MSANKNGAVSWTETVFDNSKKGKDTFLRLNPGSNRIRLLTLPHLYHQHRYEPAGGKKYGYRINCSRTEAEKSYPLCEQQNKAKRRWFVGVIDRATGTYKTLDIGYAVFKSIQTLAKSAWGTPDHYDVDIIVDPQGGPQGYYFVSPMPPTPLTAADLALQEQNPSSELESKVEAPSPQRVQERLNKIQEEIDSGGQGGVKSEGVASAAASEDDAEEDDFFKTYDKKKAG
jgi:hypothetical protein